MNDTKYVLRHLGIPFYTYLNVTPFQFIKDLCIVPRYYIIDHTDSHPYLLGTTLLELIYFYKTMHKE